MFTIEKEILITLAGSLGIVLITILQIWAMSRAKSKHHRKILELENTLNTGEVISQQQLHSCSKKKCSLFCSPGHLLQVIFGILVFVSFTCWAVYLVSIGFIEWAPLPGSLALIGLMTPIIAWRGIKHRHLALSRVIHDIEISKKAGLQEDRQTAAQSKQSAVTEPAPVAAETIPEPEPAVAKVIAETPAVQQQPAAKPIIIEKRKLPQDSILRRHFLTHLRTQIEAAYPPRPTDSILKRHFDHFIAAEMQKYVHGPIESAGSGKACPHPCSKAAEPAAIAAAPVVEPRSPVCCEGQKLKLPQDSILRRHFLAHLRAQIEAGYPSRPTDSILKRHYDSMIGAELESRLEHMEA